MPSSSTDTPAARTAPAAPAGGPRRGFLPDGAGAWVRLALVVLLGTGAVAGGVVDSTGAVYTDVEGGQVFSVQEVDPDATPAPEDAGAGAGSETEGSSAEGTGLEGLTALPTPAATSLRVASPDLAADDPTAAGTPTPAGEPTPEATPAPEATATETPTPDPAVTEPPSVVPTPWLPGPGKHRHGSGG